LRLTNSVTRHPLFGRRWCGGGGGGGGAQTSGCFCNADLPVWLHSKRDAAKSGIAKLLLLLQTPLLTDSAATAQPVDVSIRNV